jgi:hypothetical protein
MVTALGVPRMLGSTIGRMVLAFGVHNRSRMYIIVAGLSLCALLPLSHPAMSQAAELVVPVPSNHLADPSPAQTRAIERLQKRNTTDEMRLVTVNVEALKGESTLLSVPSMTTLALSKRSEDIRSPTDFTWYGTLSEAPGQATLIVRNGNITGSIQGRDALYRIEPIGNGIHALIKVDTTRLPSEHPPSFREQEKRG